jgi:hypothetical protein
MEIRPAEPTDADSLDHLYHERQTIVAQADPRLRALPGARQWQASDSHIVWVGGRPAAGYISVWCGVWPGGTLPPGAALVDDLALDAHAYHPGLGRGLVMTAQVWVLERGATDLLALIPQYDPIGQAFWRSLGASPAANPTLLLPTGYQVFQKKLT